MTLAWLRADDLRLLAEPELAILGVMLQDSRVLGGH